MAFVDGVQRELRDTSRDGAAARILVAERHLPAPVEDVWDALTSAERISRWLMPISGELRLGGTYQLDGNARGTITACDPPQHLAVTWEYGGQVSWVDVHLAGSGDGDGTVLRLEHIAPVAAFAEQWDEYGPGAVGIGWDLSLLGLADHVATGGDVDPDLTDPAWVELMRASSDAWGRASVAYGTPAGAADAAAARTLAAYTGG